MDIMTREQAERIVDALLIDLDDRRDFSLSTVEQKTRMDLREKWIGLVIRGGDGRRLWWVAEGAPCR